MLDELKREAPQLKQKVLKIGEYLKIEDKRKKIAQLQSQTQDPKLWEDSDRAKKLLRELKGLERGVAEWEGLRAKIEDLTDLLEMAKDEDEKELRAEKTLISKELEALEVKALLSGQYDMNDAILSINAGAGGTDAQDWAQILLRMYTRWAEGKEYKLEIPEIQYGEEAGLKSATIIVRGPYAYGYLKCENGVHRLVRISPFSSEGKRHTSFVSVEVIPEVAEEIKIDINPSDLRIDTYRASGPGGQHVNKTDSAVRITHLPTNIVAQSQSDRSQQANRESALRILKARLHERLVKEQKQKIEELKGEKRAIEWGSQIRSYVFQPYTMVKDHRTGAEAGNVQGVIDGEIDLFIEAALKKGL